MDINKDIINSIKNIYIVVLLFLVIPRFLTSQEIIKSRDIIEFNTFDSQKLFQLDYQELSIEFDDNNIMWMAGREANNNNFRLGDQKVILRRYNGNNFDEIKLPIESLEQVQTIRMYKRTDGLFYVMLFSGENSKLFLFNPNTTEFTHVPLPISKSPNGSQLKLFAYKDGYLLTILIDGSTLLYTLNNDLDFKFLNKIKSIEPIGYARLIELNNHFILSSRYSGTMVFDEFGSLIQGGIDQVLYLRKNNNVEDGITYINTFFYYSNSVYVRFNDDNFYFEYNLESGMWSKAKIFEDYLNKSSHSYFQDEVFVDAKGNLLYQYLQNNELVLSRYDKNLNQANLVLKLNQSKPTAIASRDLTKEIIFLNDELLSCWSIKSMKVTTVLGEFSIRSIFQINKYEYLIATDFSGWFIYNSQTNATKSYGLISNGKQYIPKLNRKIIKSDSGYWSNDEHGIIHINHKTRQLKHFHNTGRVATMTSNENKIYYGDANGDLNMLDKHTLINETIVSAGTIEYQDILMLNDKLYLATDKGLLVCENKKYTILKPSLNNNENYLLSLSYSNEYGFLAGSRLGKVYSFDLENKKFETLYEDQLGASIASLITDRFGKIWINTFAGIVAFNPKNDDEVRFLEGDGLSHNENNRYSYLKGEDGRFYVGSLRGLNIFNPDSLLKKSVNYKIELSRVETVNNNELETIISRSQLSNLNCISVGPSNSNLNIEVALIGQFFNKDLHFRYRLDNNPWQRFNERNKLSFVNLASGEYNLEIQLIDKSSEPIGNSIILGINSLDFFYNKWWFYVLISLLIGFYILKRILHLKQKNAAQIKFSQDLINMQEEERLKIALDLHDDVAQQLTLLTRKTKNLQDKSLHKLASKTLGGLRTVSKGLANTELEEIGLTACLEELIFELDESTDIFISSDITNIERHIDKTEALHIYRIVQELLSNIIKHSKAKNVWIILEQNYSRIKLTVKDNGVGFDQSRILHKKGLGMYSLKERCNIIGAKFIVNSEVGKGTTIVITSPLKSIICKD